MTVQHANPVRRAFSMMNCTKLVRLRDPVTGDYLHLSATMPTAQATQTWLGTRRQAETLQRRAIIAGQPWPYVIVPRNLLDPPAPRAPDNGATYNERTQRPTSDY